MNARSTVRDAIRLHLMKGWLMRVRCPLLAKGYPAWKCRKNYLSLVRAHPSLAERHNFARDRCLLRFTLNNTDSPEVLAVVSLRSEAEHREGNYVGADDARGD
jgi:hypothetical protein